MKRQFFFVNLFCLLIVSADFLILPDYPGQASSHQPRKVLDRLARLFHPRRADDRSAPVGRRTGGATRNDCLTSSPIPLTALTPKSEYEALTVSENPTLWFYVPYSQQSVQNPQIELNLKIIDQFGGDVETQFPVPNQAGIVGIPVQEPLQIGSEYHWYLSVTCDSAMRRDLVDVDGWIQRVEMNSDLQSCYNTESAEMRTQCYAEENMWYDMMTALVQFTCQSGRPHDWTELLEANRIELNEELEALEERERLNDADDALREIATAPIASACPPEE